MVGKLYASDTPKLAETSFHTIPFADGKLDYKSNEANTFSFKTNQSLPHGTRIRYGTYKCSNHFLDCRCTNNHTINEDKLEQWLLDNFLKKLNEHVIAIDSVEEKEQVSKNKITVEKLNDKLERLSDLYINGFISREKYETDYNKTKSQLKVM